MIDLLSQALVYGLSGLSIAFAIFAESLSLWRRWR